MGVTLWQLLAAYLVVVNVGAFAVYGVDKYRARHGQWRVSEAKLLTWAAVGGSAGAWLGMRVWNHKTQHAQFRYGVPAMLAAHGVLLYLLMKGI